jgi:hypothetical protein
MTETASTDLPGAVEKLLLGDVLLMATRLPDPWVNACLSVSNPDLLFQEIVGLRAGIWPLVFDNVSEAPR